MDRTRLQEGMLVFGSRGEKLGRIVRCDEQTFVIEKGKLFPKDYVARYEDVAEILEGDVRLARGREALGVIERGAREGPLGEAGPMGAGGGIETLETGPVEPLPEEIPPGAATPTSAEVHRAADEKIAEERADIEHDAPTARRGAPPEGGER